MSTISDRTGVEVEVIHQPSAGAFAIKDVATGDVMGRTFYLDVDHGDDATDRIFYHTEVSSAFGGRGLATILVEQALQKTTDAGLVSVALCPMVRGYVEKHPEHTFVVRAPMPRDVTAVKRHIADLSG